MTDQLNELSRPANLADSPVATVQCGPLPEWVDHQPWSDVVSGPNDAYIDAGLLRILHDSQVNLDGEGHSEHIRTVQRIVTRAGAERAAHFAVEFDPAVQRVDVHFIRVWRTERPIDHAQSAAFQILRREKKLEQLALNGRLTATLLIPDLRIDDVLEVALTVETHNPIIGRQYAGWFAFNALAPWLELRHRLRRPVDREVSRKTFGAPPESTEVSLHDAMESTWSLTRQARIEAEEFTPSWQIQVPAIQFTEFRSWDQVAQLFSRHYEGSEMPPDLAIEVDGLAARFADPADRAAEWLRFVQKQLRYFALSLGEGGLVPRDLDTIWTRRFGDCKDGSRLFVAGARRLGIDACAALTSTTHGRVLDEFLPSPSVFNHCIVRLRVGGKTYWLDPTMARQEGRLDVIFQPHSGWALPLTAETSALERLANDEPVIYRQTEEVLQLGPKPDSPAGLVLRVDYHSFAADALRHRFENEGNSKFVEQVSTELRSTWGDVVETAPLTIQDNLAENRLVATFRYEIRHAWKRVDTKGRLGFKVAAGSIATELNPLKKPQRRTDVFLGRPRKATWQARLLMPQRWSGKGWNTAMHAGGIRYTNTLVIGAREIHLQREMLIADWSLPPSQAGAYQELVAKARENLVTIMGRVALGRIRPVSGGFFALNRRPFAKVWLVFWVLYVVWLLFKAGTR